MKTVFIILISLFGLAAKAQNNNGGQQSFSPEPQLIQTTDSANVNKSTVQFSADPSYLIGDSVMMTIQNEKMILNKVSPQPQNKSEPK